MYLAMFAIVCPTITIDVTGRGSRKQPKRAPKTKLKAGALEKNPPIVLHTLGRRWKSLWEQHLRSG